MEVARPRLLPPQGQPVACADASAAPGLEAVIGSEAAGNLSRLRSGQQPPVPGKDGTALQVFICLIGSRAIGTEWEFGFLFGPIRSLCSLTSCWVDRRAAGHVGGAVALAGGQEGLLAPHADPSWQGRGRRLLGRQLSLAD